MSETLNLGTLLAKFQLDTSGAQKSVKTADAALESVAKSTTVATAAAKANGDAWRATASRISPAGAAITGLASAAGSASPLISQLASSATGLATTMATTGPLGVALAAAGVAVAWLGDQYRRAAENADAFHAAVRGAGKDALDKAKAFADGAAKALATATEGSATVAVKEARSALAEIDRNTKELEYRIKENEALISTVGTTTTRDVYGSSSYVNESGAAMQLENKTLKRALDDLRESKKKLDQGISDTRALESLGKDNSAAASAAKDLATALSSVQKGAVAADAALEKALSGDRFRLHKGMSAAAADAKDFKDLADMANSTFSVVGDQVDRSAEGLKKAAEAQKEAAEAAQKSGEEWGSLLGSMVGAGGAGGKLGGLLAGGSMTAAGGVGLAAEIAGAAYDGILAGFQMVADKVGQFDSRAGGALSAGAPAAAFGVLSMGGVLSAPGAAPAAAIALGAVFLELTKSTQSYAATQAAVGSAVDKVVLSLEPFWHGVGRAANILSHVADALGPALAGFSGQLGEFLGGGLYNSVKALAVGVVGASVGMYKLGEAVWTVNAALDGAAVHLLEMFGGGDSDLAKALRDMAESATSAASANRIAAEDAAQQLTDILNTDFAHDTLDPATAAVHDFTSALKDATYNLPTWYRSASLVSDRAPVQRSTGRGVTSMQILQGRGYVSPSNWIGNG